MSSEAHHAVCRVVVWSTAGTVGVLMLWAALIE
jgi:hypothetical protein